MVRRTIPHIPLGGLSPTEEATRLAYGLRVEASCIPIIPNGGLSTTSHSIGGHSADRASRGILPGTEGNPAAPSWGGQLLRVPLPGGAK